MICRAEYDTWYAYLIVQIHPWKYVLDRADYTICLMSDLSHPPDLSHLLDVFSLAVRKSGELLLKVMWRLFLCGACVLCRTPRVLHVVLSSVTERCPAQGTRQSCCMKREKKTYVSCESGEKRIKHTFLFAVFHSSGKS